MWWSRTDDDDLIGSATIPANSIEELLASQDSDIIQDVTVRVHEPAEASGQGGGDGGEDRDPNPKRSRGGLKSVAIPGLLRLLLGSSI